MVRVVAESCANGRWDSVYYSRMFFIHTAHKRSLQRLCFHRCLSDHGGGGVHGRRTCMAGDMYGSRHAWQEGHAQRRGCVWQGGHAWQGACMAGGHVWWVRRCPWQVVCMVGVCMVEWCAWQGGACMEGETATTAGGTHPTGMHSCYKLWAISWKVLEEPSTLWSAVIV